MRLLELRVRGFRRLRNLTLDLNHDRVLIVGPNEAGKSTVVEALLTALYGLAPARRGSGHATALRSVAPWTGEAAALVLRLQLDGGRELEVDWDFSAERTRVIDHRAGEDVTADFSPGTHGWLDVGERLLALPSAVFRQVTVVGEGQLARLSDEAEIRQALLRLTDSGVEVMVEQALSRLEDAARQATSPRSNSATRHNELARALGEADGELASATAARAALETEVAAIAGTEAELASVREELALLQAAEEKRAAQRRGLRSEVDRAEGRLAEAELRLAEAAARLATVAAASAGSAGSRPWSDDEVERARQILVAPAPTRPVIDRSAVAGWAAAALGVVLLVVGILGAVVFVGIAGIILAGIAVVLLTRGRAILDSPLEVGELTFPDRTRLMTALDAERARRDHAVQQRGVDQLRRELTGLVAASSGGGDEHQLRLRAAEERQRRLQLQLEGERSSYRRASLLVPEVAPLEERVAHLHAALDALARFGTAASLGASTLRVAAEEIRRNYAPRLQEYLGRDLARITGGRYTAAVVNDRFEVLLRAPETGSLVEISQLSRGTQQQVYLLLRLGLLEVMSASTEQLPMFLDDALALADDRRRVELLQLLEAEARQVLYFTAGEEGSKVFDARWHRVVLPPPASEHVEAGTGQLPIALV
ncbi:MAG: ATP-binding protein [Candidatus Dormibacteria bacterium]